jgi:hypothetical protein
MTDIKSIWSEHTEAAEKQVKTRLNIPERFECYVASNHITGKRLFIIKIDKAADSKAFKNIKFKGLAIQVLDFDHHKELTVLLLDNSLEDIFISFIENILEEISYCTTDNEALSKISNVIFRWKKLFDKAGYNGLTPEEQKGLIGELLLFKSLSDEGLSGRDLLIAWDGPDGGDKDFTFGHVGIEVKLTSSKYPSIKITNERQLNAPDTGRLYLFLYIVEEVKKEGFSLLGLVNTIREYFKGDLETLNRFNNKLRLLRFNDDDSENYAQLFSLKSLNRYLVDDDFPKVTQDILPNGVYNVSYSIELSSCEDSMLNSITNRELIDGYRI